MGLGKSGAQPGIAFILCNGDAANVGNEEISSGDADLCLNIFLTEFFPCYKRKLLRSETGTGTQLFIKQFGYVLLAFMHGWRHDMIGGLSIQLLDVLTQIG